MSRQPRRRFLQHTAALAGTTFAISAFPTIGDQPERPRQSPLPTDLAGPSDEATKPWLHRTVKAGMIQLGKQPSHSDLVEKMTIAKEVGFEGIEPATGRIETAAFRKAAEQVGIIIDGTVGGYHWGTTHTNPNPTIRQRAQELLTESLQQTADLGAKTFLIVPGHGKDGSPEEVRQRAFDAISKAIPLAEKLDVAILIENVWNHFLYNHDGDADQSAQPLADFVDSFGTEHVGVQFDLGNHWKYGDVAQWVRTLGPRIQKLDIKGFSRAANRFTDITEGDIDWDSARQALVDIGFTGWLAAEVGGGNRQRLAKIVSQMNKALQCDATLQELQKSS